jgi:hypothetical protein
MIRNRPLRAGCAVIVFAALGMLAGQRARADGPKRPATYPATSASASASASDRPDAEAVGSHRPWVPRRDVPPIPDARSPKPAKEEWKSAPIAEEVRLTEPLCKVKRIREWYRLDCDHLEIALVSGHRDELDLGGTMETKDRERFDAVYAVFPVRRGDRRYFELFTWAKWAPGQPDALASVVYLDGDALPQITVEGLRWGI